MIKKFKIFEEIISSPDFLGIDGKIYKTSDNDARPFEWVIEKEEIILQGYGEYHKEIGDAYPGRMWDSIKTMVFWVYPDKETFEKMCISFKEKYNITILNNDWKIIVIKSNNEIKRRNNYDDYYGERDWRSLDMDLYTDIIPVEEYIGSENIPDELYQQHLLSPLNKNNVKKYTKNIKYNLPGEPNIISKRRLKYIYQENIITSFDKYRSGIININIDSKEYVFTIKKEGNKILLMKNNDIYQRLDIKIPDTKELEYGEFFMSPDINKQIVDELVSQQFIDKINKMSIAGDKKVQAYKL